MLDGQSWRAARLVVDTGIHAFHWPRQRSVELLLDAGLSDTDAGIETDRYICWPGQALTYKVGQRENRAAAKRSVCGARAGLRHPGLPRRRPGPWHAALATLAKELPGWLGVAVRRAPLAEA